MKKIVKGFVVSVAVMLLLFTTVYASNSQKIDAILNSINIAVNGEQIAKSGESYTLSNGTKVPYSISYAGTTYLPMRKVAELLNKDVAYANGTADIKDKAGAELLPPISVSSDLAYSVDGTPELDYTINNLSGQDIKAYTLGVYCYDKDFAPVINKSSKNNIGVFGEEDASIHGSVSDEMCITLDEFKGTASYELVVIDVTFTDGSKWEQ
ncbi:MAG: hypothetical protein PHU31_01630 [Anaerotignum sp.]|nr:hypothetical protein [Anaerotignum sp.]